jgi:hypothetical protein
MLSIGRRPRQQKRAGKRARVKFCGSYPALQTHRGFNRATVIVIQSAHFAGGDECASHANLATAMPASGNRTLLNSFKPLCASIRNEIIAGDGPHGLSACLRCTATATNASRLRLLGLTAAERNVGRKFDALRIGFDSARRRKLFAHFRGDVIEGRQWRRSRSRKHFEL